ncbi:hypothetical protein Ga0100231_013570 [Opitutaceae bacterium TAV4]|nr:hypothetical protein Ga0100231_013570 [Opitutaceae bacterium TAV4]RRJ99441.1 hypothetical protein Ga0100230_014915 [Opitutaceae bacterium TAV3]
MKIEDSKFYAHIPNMAHYTIQEYHHVDDFRCLRPLSEFVSDISGVLDSPDAEIAELAIAELRKRISAAFRKAGWEGDGDINVVFVPPFLCDTGYTSCTAIFHVKQSNNGTSYIALPNGVRFITPQKEN